MNPQQLKEVLAAVLLTALLTPPSAVGQDGATTKIRGYLVPKQPHISLDQRCAQEIQECNPATPSKVNGRIGIEYTLFILLADAPPDVNGIEFGVEFSPSIEVSSWHSCSQFQAPLRETGGGPWPTSGSGNMLIFGDEVRLVTDSQRGGASVLIGTLDVIAHASGTFEFTRYPREFMVPWETRVCIGMRTNGEAWITYPDNTGTIGFGVDSGRDPCSSLTQLSPAEDLSIKADSQILARIEGSHPAHVKATWVITSNAIREVTASIYSVTGGLIRSFQPVLVSEGTTRITWDGRDAHGMRVASGSYFFVVEDASGYKAVQRTVLLR